MVSATKVEEFKKAFSEEFVPAAAKHGLKLVGTWQSWMREMPLEITHLWTYNDMISMVKSREAQNEDPELLKARGAVGPYILDETKRILIPLPYSPLQ